MDLKIFAETYAKLESKALEIMKIYGLERYDLEGIEVEEWQEKVMLNIKASFYYSGCGTETETLSFELEEMENDIAYFQVKREEEEKKKEEAKRLKEEKETEQKRLLKEEKDRTDYERLKKKFEQNL